MMYGRKNCKKWPLFYPQGKKMAVFNSYDLPDMILTNSRLRLKK